MRKLTRYLLLPAILLAALPLVQCIGGTGDDDNHGLCGNGILDPGEACDDGNNLDHDGCSSTCVAEAFCGNGRVEPGEECDDGNFDPGDGCGMHCDTEVGCGNGILEVGEECEDDNQEDGDGCSATCRDETAGTVCGDGIHEPSEGCDDGNTDDGDGCSADCVREDGCGDHTTAAPETCDDGNNVSGDGCSRDCQVEFTCGDGACDAAKYETCEQCPRDCCPKCGNGVLDEGEGCDDRNNLSGDGCSKGCTDEVAGTVCGNGIWELGEACEDGNLVNLDGCSDQCIQEYVCGDGVCESNTGETCERCHQDCCPSCGNGRMEPLLGEQCDSNDFGGKTCQSFCYSGGTIDCDAFCQVDLSGCTGDLPECGNGTAECGEQCDGDDLRGKDCTDLGYTEGTLGCGGNCRYDLSGCTGLTWYFHDDFEDAITVQGNWTLAGGWEYGVPSGVGPGACREGSCIGTVLAGDYANNLAWGSCSATTREIDLSAATEPLLVFWGWLATEGYTWDGVNVKASTDGVTWTVVDTVTPAYNLTIDNQPAWGEDVGEFLSVWTTFQADLSAYAGQTIRLRFDLRTDGSGLYPGWYIDDIVVTESALIPVEITTGPNLPRGAVDVPYSHALAATGGAGNYAWSLTGGSNHEWLTMDPLTGVLSGTPLAANAGPVTVTVRVAESTAPTNIDEQTFSLVVVTPAPLPYVESFDAAYPGAFRVEGDWEWGTPSSVGPSACAQGPGCVGTQIDAPYRANQSYTTSILEPSPIDLTGATAPVLAFYHWTQTETGIDGGNVKLSTNGGLTWSILAPDEGYDGTVAGEAAFTGDRSAAGWRRAIFNLAAYVDQTVTIRFAFRSDSATQYAGWYVDLVSVTEAADVPVALTTPPNLGTALVDRAFSRQLVAQGGPGGYDWTITPSDRWLSLSPTGLLTGTPDATAVGANAFLIRAAASGYPGNYDEQTFTVNVVQALWAEDFEDAASVATQWIMIGDWERGQPAGATGGNGTEPGSAHGGSACIATNIGGAYANNMAYTGNRAVSPSIALPGGSTPTLTFWMWLQTEGCCDGANVWISVNGGVTFTLLAAPSLIYNTTVNGVPAWQSTSTYAQWQQVSIDLSAYVGQSVRLAFALYTDGSVQYPGFYVDDLLITG
jgi:cysteine-rich repeat protein